MDDPHYPDYSVRPAELSDVPVILSIYRDARAFMRENGNPDQWGSFYPPDSMILEDVRLGNSYVVALGAEICGVFCLFEGEDPCYDVIDDGKWLSDSPYATVHRIAAKRGRKGILKAACDFALSKCSHIRADTHKDNIPMQKALSKYGFRHCGTVYVRDRSPRLAFEYTGEENSPPSLTP
ncbi:MAG: GNAT family N-acetyltransferase [Clostridia bacterium]|nr:GNAT family N-acetyltransferase [Clostridia bacterium]